jgi:hypothetical protein
MHPDQMYELRQRQHQDLRLAEEMARARRAFVGKRTALGRAWLATWLRSVCLRQAHIATPTGQVGEDAPTRTA